MGSHKSGTMGSHKMGKMSCLCLRFIVWILLPLLPDSISAPCLFGKRWFENDLPCAGNQWDALPYISNEIARNNSPVFDICCLAYRGRHTWHLDDDSEAERNSLHWRIHEARNALTTQEESDSSFKYSQATEIALSQNWASTKSKLGLFIITEKK